MEGRPVVRESTLTELRSNPLPPPPRLRRTSRRERSQPRARTRRMPPGPRRKPGALGVFAEHPEHFSLWKAHTYDQGHQWG